MIFCLILSIWICYVYGDITGGVPINKNNKPLCQINDQFCTSCAGNNCATCKSGFSLSSGKCCPFGTTNCGGCCHQTLFSNSNCGSCGNTCTSVPQGFDQCIFGKCYIICKKGYIQCGGQCVITNSDINNCGSCGTKCPVINNAGTATCVSGKCGFACDSGYTTCNGKCINYQTDTTNCGGCGNICPSAPANSTAKPVCSSGKCGFQCSGTQTLCGSSCVDETSDPNNCGSCNKVCPSPSNGNGISTCAASTCGIQCNTPYNQCNSACVDYTSDPNNCGSCNNICPGGFCTNSKCGRTLTLTFDDLSEGDGFTPILGIYMGLDFSDNNYVINGDTYGGGYGAGTVSHPNVIFNANGKPASIKSTTSFDAVSLYATSGFLDNNVVTFTGTYQGNVIGSTQATLSTTYPTQVNLGFTGIDRLSYSTSMLNIGIDNLVVNEY